ncbi:RsiV family protein [Planococcus sp. SSTMD024]|uniref:RsiV family protein n=1 Tax=Planococcus sp. SSTMD024 TaxID=3242163 RepID=UPI00351F2990
MASRLPAIGIASAVILTSCAEPVEVEEMVVAQEVDGMVLDIKVPQVEGLDAFNEEALRLGEQLEEQIRQSEQAVEEGYTDLHADGAMNFETKLLDAQTISVLLTGFLYEAGAAHGYTYKETLNYELQSGSAIEMTDLFEEENYEDDLLAAANQEMEASGLKEDLSFPFDQIKEEQQFYLTEEELVLVFDQYEITAGSMGPQEVVISKSELESLKEGYK